MAKIPEQYEQLMKVAKSMPEIPESYKNAASLLKNVPKISEANIQLMKIASSIPENSNKPLSIIDAGYDEDCDMLEICKTLGRTYKACYKGASFNTRCKIPDRQSIVQQLQLAKLQQSTIELQNKMLENQKMEEKKHDKEVTEQKEANRKSRIAFWVTFGITALLMTATLIFTIMPYYKG
jgi:hypothetical protein